VDRNQAAIGSPSGAGLDRQGHQKPQPVCISLQGFGERASGRPSSGPALPSQPGQHVASLVTACEDCAQSGRQFSVPRGRVEECKADTALCCSKQNATSKQQKCAEITAALLPVLKGFLSSCSHLLHILDHGFTRHIICP
jgi:hypothetical protein